MKNKTLEASAGVSRRDFMKTTAAGTAAILAGKSVIFAAPAKRKLKVALLGCGGRGNGALGNCLAVGYAANATVAGITINDLSITVEGDLDLHTFLGLRDGNAGFSDISVKVRIDSDASPEALQALHEKVTKTSPVGHTISRSVPVDIALA